MATEAMGIGQTDGPATGARFGRGPATAPPGFLRAHGELVVGRSPWPGVGLRILTSPKPPSDLFAEPSRAEPSRAEPSRAEPSRAEPSRAEPSRAEPSRAEPSRSRAEPKTAPFARRRAHSRPEPQFFPPRPLRAAASGLPRHHTPCGVNAGRRSRPNEGGEFEKRNGSLTGSIRFQTHPERRACPAAWGHRRHAPQGRGRQHPSTFWDLFLLSSSCSPPPPSTNSKGSRYLNDVAREGATPCLGCKPVTVRNKIEGVTHVRQSP